MALIGCVFSANAQTVSRLWISGSAVPGGVQELTKFPNGLFKFAGTLNEGTLQVHTTEEIGTTTQFYAPQYEDSYIVNHGIACKVLKSADSDAWVVPLTEDRYRFTVDTNNKKLTGELFQPWQELFLVGGAASCGWNSYVMLPFTRVKGEICTYVWTGELKNRTENNEPRRYKFTGQNAWAPKVLHPYTADEKPQTSTQLFTGTEPDHKWQIVDEGRYRITVDVFRETCQQEYLGK